MGVWQVSEERAGIDGLSLPVCVGIPDKWPHVEDLIRRFGYKSSAEADVSVYGGSLEGVPHPGVAPVSGPSIHHDVGQFGKRFSAELQGQRVAQCGCIPDLSAGGELPGLAGWAELSEIETRASHRNQGIGSWVIAHTADWMRSAGCRRVAMSVTSGAEQAGAGRFYQRFGWKPILRQKHWSK